MSNINRRNFIKLSSITVAGLPLVSLANENWYNDSNNQVETATEIYQAFKNPTGNAKPFVRWWWNGLRIEKDEIIRELDMLKELGIGGVEINSIAFPDTADALNYKSIDWLSDDWLVLLGATVEAAKSRGIICDIIVGSGWPFGDENLPKDEQTQMMALGTKNLKGPLRFETTKLALEKEVNPKTASKNPKTIRELTYLRLSKSVLNEFEPGVDLNSKISENIVIDIPEGEYILYYLVKLTGFELVIHGAPGAKGPVLNHYNKPAVEKYLNRMSDKITAKLGSMQPLFRSLFIDSLELEGANWCDDFTKEFIKRRGYNVEPYLPFIMFKVMGHAFLVDEVYGAKFSPEVQETINNVRFDFEITRLELFKERFTNTYLDWCKKNGVKSRVQAYGMESHPIEGAMNTDFPEGEAWIKPDVGEEFPDYDLLTGRAYRSVNKLVTSGARLAGKKIIGNEEATNTQMVFAETLERLKITGDQSNLSGITHSIFHGFNYSPADIPFPGWVRYGTFINERNSIWKYFHLWFNYKARLSAVFQKSEMFADIAVLLPFTDTWKGYGTDWYPRPQKARPDYEHNIWETIHQNGNGCDCVSEKILQDAQVKNGQFIYGNRKYKALILIEVESMDPKTAVNLAKFAAAGIQVICIGKWPHKSAGLKKVVENDKAVLATIEDAKSKYPKKLTLYPAPQKPEKIIDWYKKLQQKYQLKPYAKIDNPDVFVSQIYYKSPGLDIFFFANYSSFKTHSFNAEFNVDQNKVAWLWDAETGKRYIYPFNKRSNLLNITLGPAESKLIVFEKTIAGEKIALIPQKQSGPVISGDWKLTLNHYSGIKEEITLPQLVDFKLDPKLVAFGGVANYSNQVNVKLPSQIKYLNLGKVYGVTQVYINGNFVGQRWYGNQIFPIQKFLKAGENIISIALTTTLGNYMSTMKENKTAVKWLKGRKLFSQGIVGPVTLES